MLEMQRQNSMFRGTVSHAPSALMSFARFASSMVYVTSAGTSFGMPSLSNTGTPFSSSAWHMMCLPSLSGYSVHTLSVWIFMRQS